MIRKLIVVIVALAMLSLPATALATINVTAVLQPANGTMVLEDNTGGVPSLSVTFSGTSDAGTPTDTVDLLCVTLNTDGTTLSSSIIASGIATDDATGAWTYTGNPHVGGSACAVTAVPNMFIPSTPFDVATFSSHLMYSTSVDRDVIAAGINTGAVYDFDVASARPGSLVDYASFSYCGLCTTNLGKVVGRFPQYSMPLWSTNDSPYAEDGLPMDRSTNGLQIDGFTTFDAHSAKNVGAALPGFRGLAVTTSFAPSGEARTVETQNFVRCNFDNHTFVPGVTCTAWVSSGVRLTRTYQTRNGGLNVLVHDVWSSTDAKAHAVKLQLSEQAASTPSGPLFRLPWISSAFTVQTAAATLALPPAAPWAASVIENSAAASFDNPLGTVVVSSRPSALAGGTDKTQVVHVHALTVPTKGSVSFDEGYSMGATTADVATGAAHDIDLFSIPVVRRVTTTARHHVTHAKYLTVTVAATDTAAVTRVSVSGHRAKRVSAGRYRVRVKLRRGSNKLYVVAFDAAGNHSATVTVAVRRK